MGPEGGSREGQLCGCPAWDEDRPGDGLDSQRTRQPVGADAGPEGWLSPGTFGVGGSGAGSLKGSGALPQNRHPGPRSDRESPAAFRRVR